MTFLDHAPRSTIRRSSYLQVVPGLSVPRQNIDYRRCVGCRSYHRTGLWKHYSYSCIFSIDPPRSDNFERSFMRVSSTRRRFTRGFSLVRFRHWPLVSTIRHRKGCKLAPQGSPRVAEYKYAATPRPTQAGFFLRLMGDGTRMPAMAPIRADATSGAPSRLATSCDAPTAWWNWASCWAAI